jgi:predicted metal-binding membrane protein
LGRQTAFAAAWTTGRGLPLEDAIALALSKQALTRPPARCSVAAMDRLSAEGGRSPSSILAGERLVILVLLLVLAAAAWVLVLQQAGMGMDGTGLLMGMGPALFLALWIAMMVAMMFPTAAPMILVFARVHAGRREKGHAFVPTWVFVLAYLVVWTLFGALAYLLAVAGQALAENVPWLMANAARVGGLAIVLAGLYQLSPLKEICLSKCQSPLTFIMSSWRDGHAGAFRMGLKHGAYCLGCCWLLFVILFPLGMTNVAAMALITLLIFAEKSLPFGRSALRAAAAVLVAYGLLIMLAPQLLPTAMPRGMGEMGM